MAQDMEGKRFIGLIMVTMTLQEEKPKVEVGEACKEVDVKDRQACRMWTGSTQYGAVRDGTQEQVMDRFGVRMDHMKMIRTRTMIHGTIKGK